MVRFFVSAYQFFLMAVGKRARSFEIIEWAAQHYPDWPSMRAARGARCLEQGRGEEGFSDLRAARDFSKGKCHVFWQENLCRHLAYYLQFDEAELELEILRKLDPKAAERMAELYEDYRTETDDPARKIGSENT